MHDRFCPALHQNKSVRRELLKGKTEHVQKYGVHRLPYKSGIRNFPGGLRQGSVGSTFPYLLSYLQEAIRRLL